MGGRNARRSSITKRPVGQSRISGEAVNTGFLSYAVFALLLSFISSWPFPQKACVRFQARAQTKCNGFNEVHCLSIEYLFSVANVSQENSFCLLCLSQYSTFLSNQCPSIFLNIFSQLRNFNLVFTTLGKFITTSGLNKLKRGNMKNSVTTKV